MAATKFSKTLIICLIFCLMSPNQALEHETTFKAAHKDISASKNGYVPFSINKKFAVNADLDYNVTLKTAGKAAKMLLALYSSYSLLSSGCLGFDAYGLSKRYANVSVDPTETNFVNFAATGHQLTTSVFLDYKHWVLAENAVLGTNCYSNGVNFTRTGLWGILGLGFDHGSASNFLGNSPLFSIFIKPDGTSGELSFYNDVNKTTEGSSPIVALPSSPNWHVSPISSITFKNKEQKINLDNYKLIFDVNSDAIGIPDTIFKSFIQAFEKAITRSCSSHLYKPSCRYSGSLDSLPTLELTTGSLIIPIPPQVYVSDAYRLGKNIDGSMTLNFKAISTNFSEQNFITTGFKNTIILDSNFMSYFYTVFSKVSDQNKGVITLYTAKHDLSAYPKENSGSSSLIWILVIILIAAGGVVFWSRRKRTHKILIDEEEDNRQRYVSMQALGKWL